MKPRSLAGLALLALVACIGPPPRTPGMVAKVSDATAAIAVRDDFTAKGTNGNETHKDYLTALPDEFRKALGEAGYRVVAVGQPHDLEIGLLASVEAGVMLKGCWGNPGDATAVLKHGADEIDRIVVSLRDADVPCDAMFARTAAVELVNELGKSPKAAPILKNPSAK